jgi:phage gp16-like protein
VKGQKQGSRGKVPCFPRRLVEKEETIKKRSWKDTVRKGKRPKEKFRRFNVWTRKEDTR